jgi:hypothetical protein
MLKKISEIIGLSQESPGKKPEFSGKGLAQLPDILK